MPSFLSLSSSFSRAYFLRFFSDLESLQSSLAFSLASSLRGGHQPFLRMSLRVRQISQATQVVRVRMTRKRTNAARLKLALTERDSRPMMMRQTMQRVSEHSMNRTTQSVLWLSKGSQKYTQIMMRKVETNTRVRVDMGEQGAIPSPKVKAILLTYPKGMYINPSLLSVFSNSPSSPSSSDSFLICTILYEIHPTQPTPRRVRSTVTKMPAGARQVACEEKRRRGVRKMEKRSLSRRYLITLTAFPSTCLLQVLMEMTTMKVTKRMRKMRRGSSEFLNMTVSMLQQMNLGGEKVQGVRLTMSLVRTRRESLKEARKSSRMGGYWMSRQRVTATICTQSSTCEKWLDLLQMLTTMATSKMEMKAVGMNAVQVGLGVVEKSLQTLSSCLQRLVEMHWGVVCDCTQGMVRVTLTRLMGWQSYLISILYSLTSREEQFLPTRLFSTSRNCTEMSSPPASVALWLKYSTRVSTSMQRISSLPLKMSLQRAGSAEQSTHSWLALTQQLELHCCRQQPLRVTILLPHLPTQHTIPAEYLLQGQLELQVLLLGQYHTSLGQLTTQQLWKQMYPATQVRQVNSPVQLSQGALQGLQVRPWQGQVAGGQVRMHWCWQRQLPMQLVQQVLLRQLVQQGEHWLQQLLEELTAQQRMGQEVRHRPLNWMKVALHTRQYSPELHSRQFSGQGMQESQLVIACKPLQQLQGHEATHEELQIQKLLTHCRQTAKEGQSWQLAAHDWQTEELSLQQVMGHCEKQRLLKRTQEGSQERQQVQLLQVVQGKGQVSQVPPMRLGQVLSGQLLTQLLLEQQQPLGVLQVRQVLLVAVQVRQRVELQGRHWLVLLSAKQAGQQEETQRELKQQYPPTQLMQLVALEQFRQGLEQASHVLLNSLLQQREGQEERQVWLIRKYPLEQVKHKEDTFWQVRQLLVQDTHALVVVLQKVEEGQLEMHCFSQRMPVWQEVQRQVLRQSRQGAEHLAQLRLWSSGQQREGQVLAQVLVLGSRYIPAEHAVQLVEVRLQRQQLGWQREQMEALRQQVEGHDVWHLQRLGMYRYPLAQERQVTELLMHARQGKAQVLQTAQVVRVELGRYYGQYPVMFQHWVLVMHQCEQRRQGREQVRQQVAEQQLRQGLGQSLHVKLESMYAVVLHQRVHVVLSRYPVVQLRQAVLFRQALHGGMHSAQVELLLRAQQYRGHDCKHWA